jgi:tetratricopeptide (TPR) repeat protein
MRYGSFFLLIILSAVTLPAQELTPEREKEQELKRLRLRAVSMIEQTVSESMLWDDRKAAIGVLVDAAELRWPETPGEAAKWLLKAWNDAEKVAESVQDQRLKELFTRSEKTDLQARVLRVASKYDPKMAEKFIKQLAAKESGIRKDRAAFDDRSSRSEQLLRMAVQAVDTDPDLAFNLAVNSLADGVSQSLQRVLTSLHAKKPGLANRLYDLALARFSGGAPDTSEAEVLAGYLFYSGTTFSVDSAGRTIFSTNSFQQKVPPAATADPQRARNFLVAAYQAFFSHPIPVETSESRLVAQRILGFGKRMTPRYASLAPEFVQPMQTLLAQLETQLYPPSSGSETQSKNDTTKSKTREEMYQDYIAELEAQAENERVPEAKKLAYAKAALATKPEDYERGKAIADKIADSSLRTDIGSFVLYRAALSVLADKDLQKALDIAPKIDDASRKAVVKIAIARALIKSKPNQVIQIGQTSIEQQQAFDLLVDVARDLAKQEPTPKIVKILFGRTAVLADLDKSGVTASLEQIIPMLNKVESIDLRDGASPDLGVSVPLPVGRIETPRVGFDFRSAIEPLVTSEFEQLAGTVERLQAKDLRGVARFEVAKLFLEKNPTRVKAGKVQN